VIKVCFRQNSETCKYDTNSTLHFSMWLHLHHPPKNSPMEDMLCVCVLFSSRLCSDLWAFYLIWESSRSKISLPCGLLVSLCGQFGFPCLNVPNTLRATFHEVQGPGSIEIEQALLDESHKLDPWSLDEGPRPKEWQIMDKPTWHHFEGKSLGSTQNKSSKWELIIWRHKVQTRVQGKVQLKGSICFKWVQIGS
jgi:hypothetical protein